MTVDMGSEPSYLRAVSIQVVDAAGYELSAALVGRPTNAGTVESPVHTRIVQITRHKSGLFGQSGGQVSVRVRPGRVERL